jgi:phosphate transport system substrate-binding protein
MKRSILVAVGMLAGAGLGAQGVDLTGAGATFPAPIYTKWFDAYSAKTGIKINYQAIGSGGGRKQISEQTVDFGASDGPMSDDDMAKAKGGPIFHIPTVIGAVVISYNLPSVTATIKLDGPTLAAIYLGKIVKWNDSRLTALNPGVSLPNKDIVVVHRSDGSGTTFIFSDYLSVVSPEWAKGPGKGGDLQWPTGLGGAQNSGVAGQIKQIEGGIGYIELAYARQNKLPYATMKNADGKWVVPTLETASAAAAGTAARLPSNSDFRVSIVNAPGADSYPISSFTWLLIYKNQTDAVKGKKLVDFVRWALNDGQALVGPLDYAPLPKPMVAKILARVNEIQIAK